MVEAVPNRGMAMHRNLPNLLSLSRVTLALTIILLYDNSTKSAYLISVGVIGVALVTDFADGRLARHLGVPSIAGYILDGLGDRAMYIALILVLVQRNDAPLYLAWLFVFRDVAIYALRSFPNDWYLNRMDLRRFSRLHAGGIRLWFLSYILSDGVRLFCLIEISSHKDFRLTQDSVAIITIALSYYALWLQAKSTIYAAPPVLESKHES